MVIIFIIEPSLYRGALLLLHSSDMCDSSDMFDNLPAHKVTVGDTGTLVIFVCVLGHLLQELLVPTETVM